MTTATQRRQLKQDFQTIDRKMGGPLLAEPRYRVVIELGVCDTEMAAEELIEQSIGMDLLPASSTVRASLGLPTHHRVLRRDHFAIERSDRPR